MKYFPQLRFIDVCTSVIAALCLFIGGSAFAADGGKKILFFSKCSGYEDEMVRRTNGEPSVAEKALREMGKENRWEFTFTKDGSIFATDSISNFDAFCFFTSGDLTQAGDDHNPPMSKKGKSEFLQAVYTGKGFVGIYSAIDTFPTNVVDPYINPYANMIGGEFLRRNSPVSGRQIVADKSFPGMTALPSDFTMTEDWCVMRNFATNLHVLLVQDTASMGRTAYNLPNYPATWVRQYGSGRVFYTGMGHRAETWNNPLFQQILAGGLKWAVRDAEADVTPNIGKVTPQAVTH